MSVIPFRGRPVGRPENRIEDHFGACPKCGKSDGYINVGSTHWFVCDEHKTRWCVGCNLFSSWKDESEAEHRANAEKLAGYVEVIALSPEEPKGSDDRDPYLDIYSLSGGRFGLDLVEWGLTSQQLGIFKSRAAAESFAREWGQSRDQSGRPLGEAPKPISLQHERLVASLLKHWRAGLRDPEIQWAVRKDCPEAALEEFNAAADEAWSLVAPEGGAP